MRKIVRMYELRGQTVALCEDGTAWCFDEGEWLPYPAIPDGEVEVLRKDIHDRAVARRRQERDAIRDELNRLRAAKKERGGWFNW